MICTEEMRREILSRLSGYRLKHTLGCEKAARKLAKKFGEDEEKCAFAMLLHDITKEFSKEQQLNLCEKYGIIPKGVEQTEWKMLHGKTAAAIAQHEYGAPQDVVDAIAYHTTGRANMTKIEKIAYLADYIEPSRDFPGVEDLRRAVHADLDGGLLKALDDSIRDMQQWGNPVHHNTLDARDYLLRGKQI